MTSKPILVTGADGFIGSHLVERLLRDGHAVRALVYYNSFGSWGWLDRTKLDLGKLEVVPADIRDADCVRSAVRGASAVLHLAALIGIPYSYRAPTSYVQTNVVGTLNVVQAAHDFGVEKIVHTSTSEVYGTAQAVPISEAHALVGQSPYAASKIGADQIARSFFLSFGAPVTILRPFNTYGPRQSLRAVIPTIISQLARGMTELKLGALTPTRDFSFVDDTVSGFVAALKSDKNLGEVVNLGSGFEISIGDTAKEIANVMGVRATIATEMDRLRPARSEVERLLADNSKAKRLLDWSPQFGGIEGFRRGLAKTAQWFRDPANLAHYSRTDYAV